MGSGGMIVMDDTTCMVDVAKYFMGFLRDESCGKCLPCRQGTQEIYDILERHYRRPGPQQDLARLKDIADAMSQASLCGLGKTAANPVLSTPAVFCRKNMRRILAEKRCPAGVCTALIRFSINARKMHRLRRLPQSLPGRRCYRRARKKRMRFQHKKCIRCRACFEVCPAGAVEIR